MPEPNFTGCTCWQCVLDRLRETAQLPRDFAGRRAEVCREDLPDVLCRPGFEELAELNQEIGGEA